MTKPKKYLQIPVEMYHLVVIIMWEMTMDEVFALCKEHGIIMDDDRHKELKEIMPAVGGFVSHIRENNTDILVWLEKKPKTPEQYKTLYHELYHATQDIVEDHLLEGQEAGAYIYEYLAGECLKCFEKK